MHDQARENNRGNYGLQGRVAVVTGSSGGIGREIAMTLARAGCAVLVHGCSNYVGAAETRTKIKAIGSPVKIVMTDLGTVSACDKFLEEAWSWQEGVDIWINNAGADVLTTELAYANFDDKLARLWEVDVLGAIRLSRAVGRRMQERKDALVPPTIINVGWDQAEIGMAGDSGEMFATIKGAIMMFSRSLAKSLAPDVRVNCVAPGWIKTSWGEKATEYWQQRATSESLLRRWGTPQDVARVVRFLASDDASFMTGQTIAVNGGLRTSFPDEA